MANSEGNSCATTLVVVNSVLKLAELGGRLRLYLKGSMQDKYPASLFPELLSATRWGDIFGTLISIYCKIFLDAWIMFSLNIESLILFMKTR